MRSRNKRKVMTPQERAYSLAALVASLHLPIKDLALMDRAFTHTSYANENKSRHVMHNQRLEFLGDAVLDLIIAEYLFVRNPQMTEGELTKTKAMVVCESSLAACSRKLNFGHYLLLGHGEEGSGGRERPSILADVFEAFIGALYREAGYEVTAQFVLSHLQEYLQKAQTGSLVKDFKTMLQEYVQRDGECAIHYLAVGEEGFAHDKTFFVQVVIENTIYATGSGKSKKEAEQEAARETYRLLLKE